jgi:threonyl-tRNA synthetase
MHQLLDHRDLNRDLAVFATDVLSGAGLPLWLPDGAIIREELQTLAKEIARTDGCHSVFTPVLGKRGLFERSGHLAKFGDDMFPPMGVGGDELVLRPANCPHHALVYAARRHSYRELPIRFNELGAMFRAERSGVLSGLSRVRQISLDDTHVFCRPDQVEGEVARALRSALRAQQILGLAVDHVRLSRRGDGPSYLGSPEQWAAAEETLRRAASSVLNGDLQLADAAGEAAFYGPKLDLQVRDGRGHEETIATVQVDFVLPQRFDLTFDAADGSRPHVVMVHRGTVGSMERVVAALLERYQGRLPVWLAPVQVAVLPVGPDQDGTARALADDLLAAGLRPRLDVDGSLGARVRASRARREPVIAIVGAREAAAGTVQAREVAHGFELELPRDEFVSTMRAAHTGRCAPVWRTHR